MNHTSSMANNSTVRFIAGLDPCGQCGAVVVFNGEHDNFYCTTCHKGQGNEYYVKNAPLAGIVVKTVAGVEEPARTEDDPTIEGV